MARSDGIEALERAARKAGRRSRLAAVFGRFMLFLPLPLGYGVAALTLVKSLRLGPASQRGLLLLGLIPVLLLVGSVLRALLARRGAGSGAIALDQFHGLQDRVTAALSFSRLPAPERTPL